MQQAFIIKYEYSAENGFSLASIGESFVGFDGVLKDLIDIAQLGDGVEIKTTRVQHGSVEVVSAICLLGGTLFQDSRSLLEFLRLADPSLLPVANTFFSQLDDVHRSVNDYFAENQFDSQIITALIAAFILRALEAAGKLKGNKKTEISGSQASPRQINRLRRMVEGGRYARALKPIVDGSVSSIEVAALNTATPSVVKFDDSNISSYLPADARILPNFVNGEIIQLAGELVSLQSTRGDFMKIKVHNIDPTNNLLVCTPGDGIEIENYAGFFKKTVVVRAEVSRKTMFKKPELIIHGMDLQQQELIGGVSL